MRIALVVHKFPPNSIGGTEIYTLNLAQELSRRGHEVFVFYRGEQAASEQSKIAWEEREQFMACRISRNFDMRTAHVFAQFLDTFFNPDIEQTFQHFLDEVKPDIVHFQHVMSLSYRLIALARQRGLPVLLTLHDYWFLCANSQLIGPDAQPCQGKAWGLNCARCALSKGMPSWIKFLKPIIASAFQIRDALVHHAALQAYHLIAPSHFLIQQYIKAGFPSNRFIYLENGVDAERIRRYPRQPSSNGRMRFTYLGALAWQKGVHIVVEAFRGIPAEKATLRIYGDPMIFPDYSARLRQIADPNNTSFEGTIPNEEVGRVLAETDVVLVPSLWYENSPMVIQEAFTAGVPVIASQLGALTEKVRHGVNGLFCEPGQIETWRESLLSLIEHKERVKRLSSCLYHCPTIQEHVSLLECIYHNMKLE